MSGNNKLIADYSITDYLWAFWNVQMINPGAEMSAPICGQFWFIRDLMVLSISSPVIYMVVKCFKFKPVLFWGILSILWVGGFWFPIKTGFALTSCIFFTMGAFFSITGRDVLQWFVPWGKIALVVYVLSVIVQNIFLGGEYEAYLHRLDILCGVISVFYLVAIGMKKHILHENKFLTSSNFFIYAYHLVVITFLTKLLLKVLPNHTDWMMLILYLLMPVFVVLLGLFLYRILKRYFPIFIKYACHS